MGIKKLKEENKNLSLTLIDMLGRFDTSKTKKYTQFLVNELKKTDFDLYVFNKNLVDDLIGDEKLEDKATKYVVCSILGHQNMCSFIEFCDLMEKGLVEEKDISTYNSWDKLMFELHKAKNKELFKNSKKEIKVLFENEDYIILKPLSHSSSCVYGYNTKWCTAMVTDPEYFYNHSKGILVYVLDQKNNKKFGFYKSLHTDTPLNDNTLFTVWDEKDNQIDSIQTGLPYYILQLLLTEFNTNSIPNYNFFSDDETIKMTNILGEYKTEVDQPREYVEPRTFTATQRPNPFTWWVNTTPPPPAFNYIDRDENMIEKEF